MIKDSVARASAASLCCLRLEWEGWLWVFASRVSVGGHHRASPEIHRLMFSQQIDELGFTQLRVTAQAEFFRPLL